MFDQRERRELEKRMKEQKRLPPGQSATIKFPVLHYGPVPRVDLARWDFRVFGLVVEEQRWSWEAFNQLPRSQITLDIHCVTRWSKFDTLWEGVSVATLVKEGFIRPRPEARYVIQHCDCLLYTSRGPPRRAANHSQQAAMCHQQLIAERIEAGPREEDRFL